MRRIYIIPETMSIEDALQVAMDKNCPEIVIGIPPVLREQITPEQLPMVYEEIPVTPEPLKSTHISKLVSVTPTKARPARIERVWNGVSYFYDCFASQTVKDEYVAGKVAIGDYVIVHFDDIGEQIVLAKVYKSW